jgi:hypothetical protein
MTSQISEQSVTTLQGFLKGKRLEKFMVSIEILRAAEARGAYAARESQKALIGFGMGLVTRNKSKEGLKGSFPENDRDRAKHHAEWCVQSGSSYQDGIPFSVDGVAQDVVDAWVELCNVAHDLNKKLLAARPKPVITAIGLSPKVTTTLTEMNLDLDLPTITPAELEPYEAQVQHPETGALIFKKDGSPLMETRYRVKWSEGCKVGLSRFSGSGCHACGKWIPSGQYVPVEANCRVHGRVGMWFGRDCARNIFGIKDAGIAQK